MPQRDATTAIVPSLPPFWLQLIDPSTKKKLKRKETFLSVFGQEVGSEKLPLLLLASF